MYNPAQDLTVQTDPDLKIMDLTIWTTMPTTKILRNYYAVLL